ncbi:MAG: sortase [Patescibacteria group bacterium]
MKKDHLLNESDLVLLFTSRNKKRRSRLMRFGRSFLVFVLIYVAVFVAFNFANIWQNLTWWYRSEYQPLAVTSQVEIGGTGAGGDGASNLAESTGLANNQLRVEAIDVTAPVTWRVENEEREIRQNLQNGLIHIRGTALPGENGNVFITGHSSDLPWSKGSYKTVFALLGRVVIGNRVRLMYDNKSYEYVVKEIKTVAPSEISVMESRGKPVLTLMTCTPVGTTLRRLIVVADQVAPDPAGNIEKQSADKIKNDLPGVR